ncbi:hypothetical protein Val02_45690 [Virgisporangium aliadipatigenens]|uniref:Uncharacterized protein n=1 Tax=Virgisporangium aliadipatigenens TaxID=741659 RepID=A0A8J4DSB2_9ACTN|nr:hypothetical protein [Virgisporangium aliadipatigenens]GIJ47683.1 hypothetical protein Val02_45690 [Virgisporangium aliadipatigenens]
MEQAVHTPEETTVADEPPLLLHPRRPGTAAVGIDDRHYPVLTADGRIALEPGETILWQGRAEIAEYRYSEGMDRHDVRWTLPAACDVTVTDRRLAFTCRRGLAVTPPDGAWRAALRLARSVTRRRRTLSAGQVRWQWPSRLYVKRGVLLLVMGAYRVNGLPTLALSGWRTDPQPVANTIRAAVARYRLDNAETLGVDPAEAAALRERIDAPVFAAGSSQASNLPGPLLFGFLDAAEYRRPDAAELASPAGAPGQEDR